jgi:hypothetical protein
MATFTKQFLSSSVNGSFYGLPIEIETSASYPGAPAYGTQIHTPPAGSTEIDEIWLYATNVGTAAKTLVVQFGNSGSAYEIVQELPSRSGLTLMVPGFVMGKTGSLSSPYLPDGAQIAAYAGGASDSATSDILITGYVNRISGSA